MAEKEKLFDEADMDSLFVLPLSIVPLETASLKKARMIKNNRLESCIEMFSDAKTGSGQVSLDQLKTICSWKDGQEPQDFLLLKKLSKLPGYDVFTLRILFRELAIPLSDNDALRLSEKQQKELTEYVSRFTRPLIASIYGDKESELKSFEDVIRLFRDPDTRKVRKKLTTMAKSLDMEVEDIPRFLEDYGDLFLAISYFQKCFDQTLPHYSSFIKAMRDTCETRQMKSDVAFQGTCKVIDETLTDLVEKLKKRFGIFEKLVNSVWEDITPDKFLEVKKIVEGSHTTIGGALCSLTVKMNAWTQKFPNPDSSNPARISEFILNEIKPGINTQIKIFVSHLSENGF